MWLLFTPTPSGSRSNIPIATAMQNTTLKHTQMDKEDSQNFILYSASTFAEAVLVAPWANSSVP